MLAYRIRVMDGGRNLVVDEWLETEAGKPPVPGDTLPDGRRIIAVQVVHKKRQRAADHAKRLRSSDVAWWSRELCTLIDAGMTVVEAVETMQDQALDGSRLELQRELLLNLQRGMALSDAMQHMGAFPSVLVASVRASERTSSLSEALSDYLRYHDLVDGLRRKVVSAAIYPLLVLALGITVSLFLVVVILPRFSTMYADLRADTAWTTQLLVAASRFIRAHQVEVLSFIVIVLVLLVIGWRRGMVQSVVIRLGLKIRPIANAVREFRLAKLFHSMTVMFKGGYTLEEVLVRCDGLNLGADIEKSLVDARQSITRGVRVSIAFSDAALADHVTRRLLGVGERSGNFERCLKTIAERHAESFATFMERATRVVEPLLLLIVATLVGGIVVSMYLPIFDIASSIR